MAAASLVVRVAAQVFEFEKAFTVATKTAQKFEKDFGGVASSVTAQQKRMTDAFNSFSGDKLARDAAAVAAAVDKVGGASRLTAQEQARVNSLMTEAIAKYQALGQVAPKSMLDLEQATRKAAVATQEVPKQLTLADKAAGLLSSTFGQFTAAGLATQAITGATAAISDFVVKGTKLRGVETSFDRLAVAARVSSGELLGSLREATRGLVEDIDLMLSANKALLLGLPVTGESMGELAKAATTLGRAMGLDATKSLDDLITALGRSSPLILDNLGLSVKLGEANEAYAKKLGTTADALTDSERKMAFFEAAMEAARKKTAELGEQTKTLGEILQTGLVAAGNVITRFSSNVNVGIGSALSSIKNFAAFSQDLVQFGAAVAISNAALREQVAASKASAEATNGNAESQRDFVKELKRTLETMPALTAEGRKQYEAAQKLGVSTEELTKRFGLSEKQQKLLAEQTKATSKAFKDQAKDQSRAAKESAEEIVRSYEETRKALQGYYDMLLKANDGIEDGVQSLNIRKNAEFAILDGAFGRWSKIWEIVDNLNKKIGVGLPSLPGQPIGLPFLDFLEDNEKKAKTLKKGEQFGRELSGAIIGAIQGGGNIAESIGATLGSKLGESLGSTLAKSIGGKLGGLLGGALGPLGALGGQLAGSLVDKLFGHKGRDMVEAFAKTQGGFDALQKKIEKLGPEGGKLWVNLTQGTGRNNPEQAQANIDAITAALERANNVVKETAPSYDDVTAAAERYGIEVNKLGDAINGLRVTEVAQQAVKDWELLAKSGADMEEVARGMSDEMQALVIESEKWGHALPSALRPILEKMKDMGLLTDAAGDKLVDLDKLKWEKPLGESIDELKDSMRELADVIRNEVGGALSGLSAPNLNLGGGSPSGDVLPFRASASQGRIVNNVYVDGDVVETAMDTRYQYRKVSAA